MKLTNKDYLFIWIVAIIVIGSAVGIAVLCNSIIPMMMGGVVNIIIGFMLIFILMMSFFKISEWYVYNQRKNIK